MADEGALRPELELVERQVEAINRFPDQNPHPVLRMAPNGTLLYANLASAPLLAVWAVAVGERLPETFARDLLAASIDEPPRSIELKAGLRTFSLLAVNVADLGFINLYGTDVTAAKLIDRFPAGNPNPVMRLSMDGRLIYANDASRRLVSALELVVGEAMPAELLASLRTEIQVPGTPPTEVDAGGFVYLLTCVPIPEFNFINVYGTDITAARQVERANAENERLLLNILPAPIAQRLRGGEVVIADRFDEMTVLFADVVDFTPLSARLSPDELVGLLNAVFSAFDRLADRFGLEKIKTVGDAYMVTGGLTGDSTDHAERVLDMGLAMLGETERLSAELSVDLQIRLGMHVGPAVAGVIGIKKFIYDVWGDTVNTASRMESHGVPGRVQVTQATAQRLAAGFTFEARGTIDVKGKGPTATYLVLGRRGRRQPRLGTLRMP